MAVICLHKEGLPTFEIKNNVKYVRIRTRSFKSVLLTYSIIRGIANFVDMLSQKMLPKRKESNIRKSRIEKVIVPERRKKIPIFSLISDFTENSAKSIVYYLRSIYFVLPTFVRKQAHGQLNAIYELLRAPYRLMRAPYRLLRAPYRLTRRGLRFLKRKYRQQIADWSFNKLVIDELKSIKPDFIQANELNTLEAATSYKTRFSAKTRIIYDSHELEAARDTITNDKQKQSVLEKERRCLRHVDKTITVSNGLAKMLKQWHGIDADVIYSSPIVSNKFELLKSSGRIRGITGVDDDTPLAIYVGKLKIGRGHELIIEALRKVSNLHLAMMGVQPPDVLRHHQQLAKKYDLLDRIHFIEPCHHSDVPFFIADADFGIIPTQNKGLSYEYAMPNKLFEMTFAGLPVIAGNLSNMVEYIEGNNVGIIMDEKDPNAIADAMRAVLESIPVLSMNEKRHKALLGEYDGIAQGKKILNIYSGLV